MDDAIIPVFQIAAKQVLEDEGAEVADVLVVVDRRPAGVEADLARRLKKSPAAISRIFKAPHRSRVTTLQQIADALGVELADVLRRSG